MFPDITRRLIQGAAGEHLAAFDAAGRMVGFEMRASDPEVMFQPSVPLTQLVVLGQQVPMESVADRIFRPILQSAITFSYPTFGTEHLQREATQRGPSGAYGFSGFTYSTTSARTERHSWAAREDVDALGNADPSIGLSAKKAGWAQRVVQLSLEYEAAGVLTTASNYNSSTNVTAISAGDEWNDATPGDMLAVVRAAMNGVCDATQLQYSDLRAFISNTSLRSALSNAAFLTARNSTRGAGYPSIEELGNYLGFSPGALWTANPIGRAIGSTTVAPLYGDLMIIYAPGGEGNYDREYGEFRFAARFSPNDGVVGQPYLQREISSWVWPFDRRWKLAITNNTAAWLITNTSV